MSSTSYWLIFIEIVNFDRLTKRATATLKGESLRSG